MKATRTSKRRVWGRLAAKLWGGSPWKHMLRQPVFIFLLFLLAFRAEGDGGGASLDFSSYLFKRDEISPRILLVDSEDGYCKKLGVDNRYSRIDVRAFFEAGNGVISDYDSVKFCDPYVMAEYATHVFGKATLESSTNEVFLKGPGTIYFSERFGLDFKLLLKNAICNEENGDRKQCDSLLSTMPYLADYSDCVSIMEEYTFWNSISNKSGNIRLVDGDIYYNGVGLYSLVSELRSNGKSCSSNLHKVRLEFLRALLEVNDIDFYDRLGESLTESFSKLDIQLISLFKSGYDGSIDPAIVNGLARIIRRIQSSDLVDSKKKSLVSRYLYLMLSLMYDVYFYDVETANLVLGVTTEMVAIDLIPVPLYGTRSPGLSVIRFKPELFYSADAVAKARFLSAISDRLKKDFRFGFGESGNSNELSEWREYLYRLSRDKDEQRKFRSVPDSAEPTIDFFPNSMVVMMNMVQLVAVILNSYPSTKNN